MKTKSVMLFLPVLFLFSCYTPRYMYSPSQLNIPTLTEKGESKLSAAYSTNLDGTPENKLSNDEDRSKSHGFDIQAAFAVTNHFAVQAAYFNRTERSFASDYLQINNQINYKRTLTEFGIGYFRPIANRNRMMFQIFGGAGMGNLKFTERVPDTSSTYFFNHYSADLRKWYIQPGFIFRPTKNFSLFFATRFTTINFTDIKSTYQTSQTGYGPQDVHGNTYIFLEPAVGNTFSFNKLPGVSLEYQIGFSALLSQPYIDTRTFNMSFALVLEIPKLIRGNASEK